MRILVHGAPPTAPSGYGVELGLAAECLRDMGHDVAISCYAGWFCEPAWEGMPVMSCGSRLMGNGLISGNYQRWGADLLVLFGDAWTFDPGQFAGLNVMPWLPIDCDPLGVMDESWLNTVGSRGILHPVAMSEFGSRMLAAAGWPDVPVVPHAAAAGFRPDPVARMTWRQQVSAVKDAFIITKIGVNNEDDRKAFEVTLQAFALFAKKNPEALLYLHTEPQGPKSPNLIYLAKLLGLAGRVAFPDPYRRAADLYSTEDMVAIFNGSDVLDATSKGEGFGVPVAEALACGVPVIGARNSAMPEKIAPEYGWLTGGQKTWARHHQSWWMAPSVTELARTYEKARTSARSMRPAAAKAGERWSVEAMSSAWRKALTGIWGDALGGGQQRQVPPAA